MRAFRAHIIAVILVLLASVCISCENTVESDIPEVLVLSIKGCIYDADVPVDNITVRLLAYDRSDTSQIGEPIAVYTTYSSQSGQYSFVEFDPVDTFVFKITVSDESVTRTEHYRPDERALYLSSFSPCYSASLKSYTLEDNDFYLSK